MEWRDKLIEDMEKTPNLLMKALKYREVSNNHIGRALNIAYLLSNVLLAQFAWAFASLLI